MKLKEVLLWGGLLCSPLVMKAGGILVDFEDVRLEGAGVERYTGPGGGLFYAGSDFAGGFSSQGVAFWNSYTDWGGGFYAWNGWAYSTTTDTSTAGYGNQYSAFPGMAASGSVYAVTYAPSSIQLPAGFKDPQSISVANTTYAGISMRDGDDFARQFTRQDQDHLVLTIGANNDVGEDMGTIHIYLADFRDGTGNGYIQEGWETVDLRGFGPGVAELTFSLHSTDSGQWGMNTPSYFAVDDLLLDETPSWGGYDLQPDGWVDTGDVLGWVYPVGDYVFLHSSGKWVYLPEQRMSDETCIWVGVLQQGPAH